MLTGGGNLPAIQVPSSSLLSFSNSIQGKLPSKAYGGRGYTPHSASELTITKLVDSATPKLAKAAAKGTHFKQASLSWTSDGGHGLCLTDAYVTSDQVASSGNGQTLKEKIAIGYAKAKITAGSKPPCGGGKAPPVVATLLRVGKRGSSLLARVDCLSARCKGRLTISLPRSACPRGRRPCSTRVGLGGAGKFSMGDGSVKIFRLAVPSPLRKWVTGHRRTLHGAIIVVVRGRRTALVQRGLLLPAVRLLPAGVRSETLRRAASKHRRCSFTSCAGARRSAPHRPSRCVRHAHAPPRGRAGDAHLHARHPGPPRCPLR